MFTPQFRLKNHVTYLDEFSSEFLLYIMDGCNVIALNTSLINLFHGYTLGYYLGFCKEDMLNPIIMNAIKINKRIEFDTQRDHPTTEQGKKDHNHHSL